MCDSRGGQESDGQRAAAKPHYVLLPRADYERLAQAWGLPALEIEGR